MPSSEQVSWTSLMIRSITGTPSSDGMIRVTTSQAGSAPLQATSLALMWTRSRPAPAVAPTTGSEAATR